VIVHSEIRRKHRLQFSGKERILFGIVVIEDLFAGTPDFLLSLNKD